MIYEEIGASICSRLNSEFALLGAVKNDGSYNFMTVSWGGFGILWGKEVCFLFVRPERHTFNFTEEAEFISLSFFDKNRHSDLLFCGKVSGKDHDKAKECNFKVATDNNILKFEDATLTLTLRKMYAQDISESCFIDKKALSFYKDSGFHKMYVCEVVEAK